MTYNPFQRGTAPVGVRTLELSDDSRRGRSIPVEVWYPAASDHHGQDLDEATCDRYTIAPGLPATLQRAVREAKPAKGRFPLVLHSPAAASHRRDAAPLACHLASHGYVVAAPEHNGDTLADALADAAAAGTGAPKRRASDEETIANRPPDALFTLDRILGGTDSKVATLVDMERIGTSGVSLGGWTVLRLHSLDRRSKATFVAAPSWGARGPFPQTKLQTSHLRFDDWGRPVPTFLVAGGSDMLVIADDLRELNTRLPSPKRFAVLRGASHFHWAEGAEQLYEAFRALWESGAISVPGTDVAALAKATPPFSQLAPNWHGTETLQTLCLAHMDAYLKADASALQFLDGDLSEAFASRGIDLEVEAANRSMPV